MTDKALGTAAGDIFAKAFTLGYETGRKYALFPATEPAAVRDGSDLVVVERSHTAKAVQSWMTLDLWTDLGKNDKDFDAEYERQGFGDLWAILLGEVRALVQATEPAEVRGKTREELLTEKIEHLQAQVKHLSRVAVNAAEHGVTAPSGSLKPCGYCNSTDATLLRSCTNCGAIEDDPWGKTKPAKESSDGDCFDVCEGHSSNCNDGIEDGTGTPYLCGGECNEAERIAQAERIAELEAEIVERQKNAEIIGALHAKVCDDVARAVGVEVDPGGDADWAGIFEMLAELGADRDSRTHTPPHHNPVTGTTRITVQRACNRCGRNLGDATEKELDACVNGTPLPDVHDECGCDASPVVTAPAETGPWQTVDAIPEGVTHIKDCEGYEWHRCIDGWKHGGMHAPEDYGPFVAAEEG